jgi:hypothetical protein
MWKTLKMSKNFHKTKAGILEKVTESPANTPENVENVENHQNRRTQG